MTAQDYEAKYLNKHIRYETSVGSYSTKLIVYGKIDRITREDALGTPEVIFMMKNQRYAIDEEYFEDAVTLL